ncbi:MAG: hypothetical protein GY714_21865 [Desulfobacterales bacterium]|nr:hypothetical protein [Desulfobacterales bacterium]
MVSTRPVDARHNYITLFMDMQKKYQKVRNSRTVEDFVSVIESGIHRLAIMSSGSFGD